jgi:hypothetical protein
MMMLAANDNFSHPVHWAPFSLVGDGVVRKCRMDGKPVRQFHLLEQFIDGAIYYLQPDRHIYILLI